MDALDRHERIALQLSGGRDSLACLHLLRPHWSRLTVYWLNTGAAFPETEQLMREVRALVPHFEEIDGRQPAIVRDHGMPTDILPATSTPLGVIGAGGGILLQDRYSCCARVIMNPMHARMVEDDITLIIRGQRQDEALKSPLRSGAREGGIELLFPIKDWTARQVMDFLVREGVPAPRFYEMLQTAPDCMTCSAYWEEGVSRYLKRYHHGAFIEVQARFDLIKEAVAGSIENFNREIEP